MKLIIAQLQQRGIVMPKNMGSTDRIVRTVIALLFAALILTNVVSGALAIVLGVLAAVFLVTAVIGFCPLYLPFHFSTSRG
jgi:uncharacterized MAPEG superfamily protein